MADNIDSKVASNVPVATDEVTYSGDAGQHVQLFRPVLTTGAEGAKTVVDLPGDNANGLDVDVTRLPSLPAGSNNIGDVDVLTLPSLPAGTNNIGDVDVLTLPSLVAGTAYIGKVRLTDGTNDITFSTTFGDGESNTQTAFVTDAYNMMFNGTTWDRFRGDVTNGLDVDVTRLPSLVAGTAYIGRVRLTDGTNDLTIDTTHIDAASNTDNHYDVGAYLMGYNGTTWDRLRSDITNGLDVDVTRLPAIPAGTNYIGRVRLTDGTNDATITSTGALEIGGGIAHDSPDAGNPVKVGMKAVSFGATPTAVAAADRSDWLANRAGIPFTLGGHPNLQSSEYITTTAATDDNILPAITAGTIYVITGITVTCSAANTVNTSVRIGFGATTVPTQGASQADAVAKVLLSHPGIAPGSGVAKGHSGGIVGIGGDGEELRITTSAPTSGSLVVQVDWFTIAG